VWADVRDIDSHVNWMRDTAAIRFLTKGREGSGTRFECDTRVGPFSLTDVMEITAWEDECRTGVPHVGLVEGSGELTLTALDSERTEFRWEDDLTFPWFLGGPIGAFLARPVLRFVWNRKPRAHRGTHRCELTAQSIGVLHPGMASAGKCAQGQRLHLLRRSMQLGFSSRPHEMSYGRQGADLSDRETSTPETTRA
jgi:hypothetical protein